ncbi:50S ribosomal protein L24 [Rhodopirellula sp. MGV]|uniref:50S ribosomal protein L24 n=1 Tax=Rhodopirellula sp. MGV TaxID=2023130 RepID=UPI000B970501|nr:50S ribosomal protein L24 [Rhodopirellula sp. MGV]OYP29897.1 50S ribosomal protein L24 [Rhodopirellula sp. MGV]PNY33778.1 50S ribosomal protein L24 [Rhodopirellula baltica]
MLLQVDDEVLVISGGDKGHRGKVLVVDRKKNKVVVEGAGLVRKHVRRSQKNPQGGRLSKEMPIHASNVMVIDPTDGKPTRIGVRYLDDGSKERFAKKSGKSLGRIAPARESYKKS